MRLYMYIKVFYWAARKPYIDYMEAVYASAKEENYPLTCENNEPTIIHNSFSLLPPPFNRHCSRLFRALNYTIATVDTV